MIKKGPVSKSVGQPVSQPACKPGGQLDDSRDSCNYMLILYTTNNEQLCTKTHGNAQNTQPVIKSQENQQTRNDSL